MLPIRSLDLVDSNITQILTGWTYFLHFPVTCRVARAFSGVFYIGSKYLPANIALPSVSSPRIWNLFPEGGHSPYMVKEEDVRCACADRPCLQPLQVLPLAGHLRTSSTFKFLRLI